MLVMASLVLLAPVHEVFAKGGGQGHATARSASSGREAVGPVTGQAVERSAPAPGPFVSRARASEPSAPPPPSIRENGLMPPPMSAAAASADDQRRRGGAGQAGGRARGDNPVVGRAVPRDARPASPPPVRNSRIVEPRFRSGAVYVPPRAYNYYYYPRRYYPYGFGAFGLGYFYYDPYLWYPPAYSPYYGGYYGGGYYNGVGDQGELRLAVNPRDADVYVDGYFAGRVDEFDGTFQSLKLQSGPHHIQIIAQGFAPLDFDVRIEPGQKTTYRGALQPYRP